MRPLNYLIIIISCLFSGILLAQFNPETEVDTDIRPPDVIIWQQVSGKTLPDGRIVVGLRLLTKDDFTLYTTKVKFAGPAGFNLVDQVTPPTQRIVDPITLEEVDVFHSGAFELYFLGPEAFTDAEFPVKVTYIGCTSKICLFPYTETINIPVFASSEKAMPAKPEAPATAPANNQLAGESLAGNGQALAAGASSDLPCTPSEDFSSLAISLKNSSGKSLESSWTDSIFARGGLSIGLVSLALIFLIGVGTNATPCVFPMIPITIRLLANRGGSPFVNSSMYAAGIVVTYSALGIAAAASGSMFGSFMQLPWVNVVFAAIMFALALSMLGFGDFSKLQMLGNRLGAGKPSLINTFLMGTGAGLVAAPCTGPLLASLLAHTAKSGDFAQGSLSILIYSLGFGLPYVFLGSFAGKATTVKVSPKIQVGVKLLFAAIMFCLSFYYLRVPMVSLLSTVKHHWAPIAAIVFPLGLVLSSIWLLVPRLQNDKVSTVFPTLILGLGLFAGVQWYTLVDTADAVDEDSKLTWFKTEAEAYSYAKRCGKPVLVDMWAEWCEACKKMDKTTFLNPTVRKVLGANWVLLKLDLTESSDENDEIQERYELQSLPTLVLVPPSGELRDKVHLMGYQDAQALTEKLLGYNME